MKLDRLTEIVEVLAGRRGAAGKRAVRVEELDSYQTTIRQITTEARSLLNRLGIVVDVLGDPDNLPADADAALSAVAAARALAGIGANHVPNSDFADGLLHWAVVGSLGGELTWDLNPGGETWAGPDSPTMRIFQDGNAAQTALVRMTGVDTEGDPLYGIYTTPGDWYQVSAKLSTHRCIANLYVRWIDEDGNEVSTEEVATLDSTPGASDNPDSWGHLGAVVQAPTGAVYRQIEWEKEATEAGQADSYAFLYQPFSVRSKEGALLADYSPGRNPVVAGSRILAESIETRTLKTDSFEAAGLSIFNGVLGSDDFVTGTAGWQIEKDGDAEFNNLVVRGWLQDGAVSDGGTDAAATATGYDDNDVVCTLSTGPINIDEFWHFAVTLETRRRGKVSTFDPKSVTWSHNDIRTSVAFQYRTYDGATWSGWDDLWNASEDDDDVWTSQGFVTHIQGSWDDVELRVVCETDETSGSGGSSDESFTQTNIRLAAIVAQAVQK